MNGKSYIIKNFDPATWILSETLYVTPVDKERRVMKSLYEILGKHDENGNIWVEFNNEQDAAINFAQPLLRLLDHVTPMLQSEWIFPGSVEILQSTEDLMVNVKVSMELLYFAHRATGCEIVSPRPKSDSSAEEQLQDGVKELPNALKLLIESFFTPATAKQTKIDILKTAIAIPLQNSHVMYPQLINTDTNLYVAARFPLGLNALKDEKVHNGLLNR